MGHISLRIFIFQVPTQYLFKNVIPVPRHCLEAHKELLYWWRKNINRSRSGDCHALSAFQFALSVCLQLKMCSLSFLVWKFAWCLLPGALKIQSTFETLRSNQLLLLEVAFVVSLSPSNKKVSNTSTKRYSATSNTAIPQTWYQFMFYLNPVR